MSNNINKIKFFLQSENKKLFINKINEDIDSFYIFLIETLAFINDYKVKINQKNPTSGLFNEKNLYINNILSKEFNEDLINIDEKIITFIDYKKFKLIKNQDTKINSFEYITDLKNFLLNELKISNNDLFELLKISPHLIYSEVNKFNINSDLQNNDLKLSKVDLKKFSSNFFKHNKGNLLEYYLDIKKAALYRKFNFLTS